MTNQKRMLSAFDLADKDDYDTVIQKIETIDGVTTVHIKKFAKENRSIDMIVNLQTREKFNDRFLS